jgi:exopolysaccharide production protein ExoQ
MIEAGRGTDSGMRDRRAYRWFAAFALFVVLAGDAFRYSLTWVGWIAVVLAVVTVFVVLLVRARSSWHWDGLPFPLLLFGALTILSIAWSQYRLFSLIGVFATLITIVAGITLAILFSGAEVLWALGTALKFLLGLSLLFEMVVAVFVRQPILPWWVDYAGQKIHPAEYWSRDLLFAGDRIQGIVGNSNLLGFAALLGLIVFAIQLAARTVRVGYGIGWIAVALLCMALTRSGTVIVAAVIVAVVAIILLLVRRTASPGARIRVYVGSLVVVALGVIAAVVFHTGLLALLNKSPDLTGRTDIWAEVIRLAQQRPIGGWGWISYWYPGIAPFNDHAAFVKGGIQLLQAHDAWLDVWFQLGIVGLVIFGCLVLSTVVRAWILAVDPIPGSTRYSPTTLLAILLLVALLAQSLAESRLLIEYGMFLLSYFATSTKRGFLEPARPFEALLERVAR